MRLSGYLIVAMGALLFHSCNNNDIVLPNFPSTIFSVNSKMTHAKDTIHSSGDSIWLTAQGLIADTSNSYPISVTLKAMDPSSNILSGLFVKKLVVKFDTVGYSSNSLYHWTATLAFPIPAVAPKTLLSTSGTFAYGLSLSSELGNLLALDPKTTYAK